MDEQIANKIADGEVVEKCVSIVKELVENSIDAKSSEIKVILKEAGIREIKVIDNTTKNVEIKFNDELVFSGSLKTPDVFELTFDENKNLKSIKHI